jgi:hypothetical protein
MSQMAFDHLLSLSLAFHTRRKTGEILRILDRGQAINHIFEVRFPHRETRTMYLKHRLFFSSVDFVQCGAGNRGYHRRTGCLHVLVQLDVGRSRLLGYVYLQCVQIRPHVREAH